MPKNVSLPLSLYVHIPWCLKKCPYCDFNSHPISQKNNNIPEIAYVETLLKDLYYDIQHCHIQRPLSSIFIGGGTPSLFSGSAIDCLLTGIHSMTDWTDNIEITLEANPSTFEQSRFSDFYKAGINRISIGVQSFDNAKLHLLGRTHSAGEAEQAVQIAQNVGFKNINIDLMYGLPQQTCADALSDLNNALALNPNHISWYELTQEPHTLFYQQPPKGLPNQDLCWDIQINGQKQLLSQGYQHYEISAFSQPQYVCQHNLNYWQFGDYIGIGAGSHGKITCLSSNNTLTVLRIAKPKHPKQYFKLINSQPSSFHKSYYKKVLPKDLLFEFMLNHLRLNQPTPLQTFTQRTGLPISSLQQPLQEAINLKLVYKDYIEKGTIRLTKRGRSLLNNVLQCFL